MADLTKFQLSEVLRIARVYVPDAEFAPEESWGNNRCYEFQDTCGCYSEYTTESCSFSIWIKGTFEGDGWNLRSDIEIALASWVRANLSFSGCTCCSGDDYEDTNEAGIYVNVHLFNKTAK